MLSHRLTVLVVSLLTLTMAACGSDPATGPTDEELLAAIEGRVLSPAEVGVKLETADLLCSLDPDVLQAIWRELEPEQFDFQEFVFNHRCPDRAQEFLRGRAEAIAANTTTTSTTIRRTTTTRRTTTSSTAKPADSTSSASSTTTTEPTTTTTRRTTTTEPTTTTTRPTTTTEPTTTTTTRPSTTTTDTTSDG